MYTVMMKGKVQVSNGQHYVQLDEDTTTCQMEHPKRYPIDKNFTQVHHFKWDSSVLERLQEVGKSSIGESWGHEYKLMYDEIAKNDLQQILTDHAFLEQKAASNAVSLIINYSEETELVKEMSNIAIEEMQHFKMVHLLMVKRGMVLGREQKNDYAIRLQKFFPKTKKLESDELSSLSSFLKQKSYITLNVLKKNRKAINLYEKLGYSTFKNKNSKKIVMKKSYTRL